MMEGPVHYSVLAEVEDGGHGEMIVGKGSVLDMEKTEQDVLDDLDLLERSIGACGEAVRNVG